MRFCKCNLIMNRLKSKLHILHTLKNLKPQARRALIPYADNEIIKLIVECAIYKLNGNHKLNIDEKSKLKKHKNSFRAFVNPKSVSTVKVNVYFKRAGLLFQWSLVFVGCNRNTN